MKFILCLLSFVSVHSAYAETVCGQIESIVTEYTPEKIIPGDYSNMDQGYNSSSNPTVIPAVEDVKIVLAGRADSLTVSPKDVKLTLAIGALGANLKFCFDKEKNTASIRR